MSAIEQYTRDDVFNLLRDLLVELTDNRFEDIRENSLIYGELNLTEFDLQRIVKQIGAQIELDVDEMLAEVANEQIVTVADLLDLIIDEKDLG
ncbi:MAG: hypothetical protein Q4G02_00835 [bacterium]|nr:hypothetical protein [bacterium]